MLTHDQVWKAIDRLAHQHNLSISGLAKKSGLDPTAFNKSKRYTPQGKERWPSMESIAKVLEATGVPFEDFAFLLGNLNPLQKEQGQGGMRPIPIIGFAQAGTGGFFSDGGFPVGGGWDYVRFPDVLDDNAYALEVSGDSMEPLYRAGDILVVSPGAEVRKGDRIVAKTFEGEVLAKILNRKTASRIELLSLNPEHPPLSYRLGEIEWIARILWASQ